MQTYLWEYLRERFLKIEVNNSEITRNTGRGLAQGDPLSPLLFNVSTLDICKNISNDFIHISQYADDFVIYTTNKNMLDSINQLKNSVIQISELLSNLGLDISPAKSKICVFKKGVNRQNVSIQIKNSDIPVVNNVKYLGLWLDSSLRWGKHIKELSEKTSKLLNILKLVAGAKWGIHPTYLRRLYISLLRSRLDYAGFLFGDSCQNNLFKLDKIQNQAMRIIGGFIKSTPIHVMGSELGLESLHIRRCYLSGKYYFKCKSLKFNTKFINLLNELSLLMNKWNRKNKPMLLISHEYLKQTQIHISTNLEIFCYDVWVTYINLKNNLVHNVKGVHLAKKRYNLITLKNMCLDYLNNEYKDYYQIFTDGSKERDGAGAAFFDPHQDTHMLFKVNSNVSIMYLELLAISEAISYANSLNYVNFVILTDSKSAI